MIRKSLKIWDGNEYSYPMAWGFVPKLMTYIHEENNVSRACVLVAPGGAYSFVSPSEGEIAAKKFYDMGFNTFVLTYTINMLSTYPLKMQPLEDISRAVRYIRANGELFHINSEKLTVCGFSAGGHLCGSLCVHYKDVVDKNRKYKDISNRPYAAILCYPVISAGKNAHKPSFEALLGTDATEEELNYFSLETQVTKDVPPCFIWQTVTDETVPVINSYLFANALREKGVTYAHHVFSNGAHGLSVSDDAFTRGEFGEPFTMEQTFKITEAIQSGKVQISEETRQMLELFEKNGAPKLRASREVSMWPEMANSWLKTLD